MTGYDYSRQWFNFAFENQDKVSTKHGILYFWIIELNNRLGWVENFKVPFDTAGAAIGINRAQTVRETLYDLASWGFVRIVIKGANQNVSIVVSLKGCEVSTGHSLENSVRLNENRSSDVLATVQAVFEQPFEQSPSSRLSTVPIDKQENKETFKQTNLKTDDANRVDDFEEIPFEEKKETPSKVASKVSPTVHAKMKEIILGLNEGYYWTAKDGKALKGIITKISFRLRTKNKADPTDEQIVSSFSWMMRALPEWYQNKWDTCTIESKFESIVKQIIEDRTNGKSNHNNQPGPSGISPRLESAWELLNQSRKERPT